MKRTPVECGHTWTDMHGTQHSCFKTRRHQRHVCRCYWQGGGWIPGPGKPVYVDARGFPTTIPPILHDHRRL